MVRTGLFLIGIIACLRGHCGEVIELASFPESTDPPVMECYERALDARARGTSLCVAAGFGDYWACPQSWEIRLDSLEQCENVAGTAEDKSLMLYLLGLLHQDLNLQSQQGGADCPRFHRYQEGSAVCVYTDHHFEELLATFPDSEYADMAAYKRAERAYRYYECEDQRLCAVENQITGWIDFLNARPLSPLAEKAASRIVDALDALSSEQLDPLYEHPDRLLKDVQSLKEISQRMSAANRDMLSASLARTDELLARLVASRPR